MPNLSLLFSVVVYLFDIPPLLNICGLAGAALISLSYQLIDLFYHCSNTVITLLSVQAVSMKIFHFRESLSAYEGRHFLLRTRHPRSEGPVPRLSS